MIKPIDIGIHGLGLVLDSYVIAIAGSLGAFGDPADISSTPTSNIMASLAMLAIIIGVILILVSILIVVNQE